MASPKSAEKKRPGEVDEKMLEAGFMPPHFDRQHEATHRPETETMEARALRVEPLAEHRALTGGESDDVVIEEPGEKEMAEFVKEKLTIEDYHHEGDPSQGKPGVIEKESGILQGEGTVYAAKLRRSCSPRSWLRSG